MTVAELRKWQKNIKKGDLVKFQPYFAAGPMSKIVHRADSKTIWFAPVNDAANTLTLIKWDAVLEVYTREDNPEYFL